MNKNCMNCLLARPTMMADGHKRWTCGANGFTVNSRMTCEEWNGRYHYPQTRITGYPKSKQSLIFD